MRIPLLSLCLLASPLTTLSPQLEPISQVHSGEDSEYLFLKDSEDQSWIYKQYRSHALEDQVDLLFEALAFDIAKPLSIPLNEVRLIKASDSFSHVIYKNQIGSLHKKVPGTSADRELPWEGFDLQQMFRSKWTEQQKGALPKKKKGLRRIVIQNMAKHPSLPQIVALDTYLGNNDRSLPNIFYDKVSDQFYGIDMGNSFKGNLAQEALLKIQKFHESEAGFSPDEITALLEYGKALEELSSQFPPDVLISKLHELCTDYLNHSPEELDEDTFRKLMRTTHIIHETYQSTQELIKFIHQIT